MVKLHLNYEYTILIQVVSTVTILSYSSGPFCDYTVSLEASILLLSVVDQLVNSVTIPSSSSGPIRDYNA